MDTISERLNWEDLVAKLKKKYPQLTDSDLQYNVGMEEGMLRMVEYKLRKTKGEMKAIIDQMNCNDFEKSYK